MPDHDPFESLGARPLSRRAALTAAAAPAMAAVAASVARGQTGAQTGGQGGGQRGGQQSPAAVAAAAGCASAGAAPPPNERVALVTGSSRGIGAATARRLARDGFRVTVNYVRNRDLAAAVVRDIEAAGGRAVSEQADVSDPAAVRRLFDVTQRTFGGVDVVVSNAGIMRLAPFREMTDEDFDRMFAVNAKGSFNVLREAARRVRDGGRVITLASNIVELRSPTYGPYAATKAAQQMYAGALSKELGARRISVSAIAPGLVNTTLFTDGKTPEQIQQFVQRTPLGRLGEPSDIANVIAALCARDGHWISGQTVEANGAFG